jgi:hypothetical protein
MLPIVGAIGTLVATKVLPALAPAAKHVATTAADAAVTSGVDKLAARVNSPSSNELSGRLNKECPRSDGTQNTQSTQSTQSTQTG